MERDNLLYLCEKALRVDGFLAGHLGGELVTAHAATLDALTAAEARIEAALAYQSSIDWGNTAYNANRLAAILQGDHDTKGERL
jgi:hypothetical protein